MPITRRQFDLGVDSALEGTMRKIHRYLHAHRDEAFCSSELAELLRLTEPDVREAVETLEDIGALDTRRVESTFYHAYLAEIPDL